MAHPDDYLELAINNNQDDIVKMLLDNGANPLKEISWNKSLIDMAVYNQHFKIVKLLVDAINIANVENPEETTNTLEMIADKLKKYYQNNPDSMELLYSLNHKISLLNPEKFPLEKQTVLPDTVKMNIMDKTDFINELMDYHEENKKSEDSYFFGLFASNKENNNIAVTKMLKALHGDKNVTFDNKDIAACNDKDLGKIINKYRDKNVLPQAFVESESQLQSRQTGFKKS